MGVGCSRFRLPPRETTYHARRRCSSLVPDECIEGFSQIRKLETPALGSLVGGQVESAEAAAHRGASADSGVLEFKMNLEDVIERNSRKSGSGAVFVGTTVPIKLLFEFLGDDQTMDTFLDQFPTVSRDQARAVLGASLNMLLSAAGAEI
jgi:uncharacterized protein (DUF433 family)